MVELSKQNNHISSDFEEIGFDDDADDENRVFLTDSLDLDREAFELTNELFDSLLVVNKLTSQELKPNVVGG